MAEHGTTLSMIKTKAWRLACKREPVIRALAAIPRVSRETAERASRELRLGRSQLFLLLARYRKDPVTSSLVDHPNGFPKGRHRMARSREEIVTEEIERFYLTRPKPRVSQLVRAIEYACHDHGLPPPVRKTIEARIAEIDRRRVVACRDGQKAADDQFRSVKGSYQAEQPLAVLRRSREEPV